MNLLSKINSKRVYLLITLSLITFSIAMPRLEVGELKQVPIYPLPFIEHLSLGYSENLADSMWIRAIQDFNYCEKKAEKKCQAKGWLY